jgi:hypothetical protein
VTVSPADQETPAGIVFTVTIGATTIYGPTTCITAGGMFVPIPAQPLGGTLTVTTTSGCNFSGGIPNNWNYSGSG